MPPMPSVNGTSNVKGMILIITIATKTTLPPTGREKAHEAGTLTDTYTGEKFAANDKRTSTILLPPMKFTTIPGVSLPNVMVPIWLMIHQI